MSQYDALLKAASAKYGVPLNLLTAQMQTESAGNPLAVSSAGAQGLMQIMPSNFKAYGLTNSYDPAASIDVGAHMDADNYKATGNWPDALRMYHGGTDKANWGPKTQAYEGKIMGQVMPSFGAFDGSMAQPAANLPSFDDFNSVMSGGAKAAPSQAAQPTQTAQVPSFQEMDAQMNAPVQQPPGVLRTIFQGFGKGIGEGAAGIEKVIGKGLKKLGATQTGTNMINDADQVTSGLEAENAPYAAAHPYWNAGASLGGNLLMDAPLIDTGMGALTGGLRVAGTALGDTAIGNGITGVSRLLNGTAGATTSGLPSVLAKGASLSTRGAAAGAAFNGLTGGDPLTGAEWGAAGAPIAGVAGKAASVVAAPVVRAVGNAITDLSPEWTANAAANKLTGAMMADGITPKAVAEQMRLMGPQATPIDAVSALMGTRSGGNLRNLGEVAANSPGEGQALANQIFGARTEGAPARINDAIKAATGATGNIHAEATDLMAQRAAAARPLYEKAFAGGSTAPLESQFEQQFSDIVAKERAAQQNLAAAQGSLTNAMGKSQLAGPDAYSVGAANDAQKSAQTTVDQAQNALQQIQAEKESVLARLRQAQADGTANAPGAVWNPRIQQFLDDPITRSGIQQGLEIQRLEALRDGVPFNPTEYGVIGTEESGAPIVGSVPNMRLLDAAKRGLDNILEQSRDPTTGRLMLDQRGRAIEGVRQSLLNQLDTLNPDYAAARAAWAGPSSSLDALAMGRKALTNDAEVTASNVARMSPSDRQFFLSGVTRALQDKIAAAQDGADATRKIFGNDLIRNRIAAAFDDPEAFAQFEQQMNNEAQFAATKNAILSNSATARRMAGQADQGDIYGPLLGAAKSIVRGNPAGAASNAAQASGAIRNALIQPSARQLAAQSRLLFTQNPDEFAAAFQKNSGALRNFLTGGR